MSSTANLQLRFDGPELQAHEMDVTLLAPSLMAFGAMCQEANRVLNGDQTKLKVLLKADIKANCVTIDLSLVQTIWDAAKSLVQGDNAATAKTILEWIGILVGAPTTWTLLRYLLWKKDKKVTEIQSSNDWPKDSDVSRIAAKTRVHLCFCKTTIFIIERMSFTTRKVNERNRTSSQSFWIVCLLPGS